MIKHRVEAALRKQLKAKNCTVKEIVWKTVVSQHKRDTMVRKLLRKTERLTEPKNVFEIFNSGTLHELFDDISLDQIARQKRFLNLC